MSDWADRVNSRHTISVLSFSLLCLSRNKPVGLAATRSESILAFEQLALRQCYRNTYQCFRIAVGLSFFFFLLLHCPSNTGLSQRYLVSNFCIVGRGNNWKWTPGLWTPRDQWENNSVSGASQRQRRDSSSETLISSVWPESGAFRAGRTRTF